VKLCETSMRSSAWRCNLQLLLFKSVWSVQHFNMVCNSDLWHSHLAAIFCWWRLDRQFWYLCSDKSMTTYLRSLCLDWLRVENMHEKCFFHLLNRLEWLAICLIKFSFLSKCCRILDFCAYDACLTLFWKYRFAKNLLRQILHNSLARVFFSPLG